MVLSKSIYEILLNQKNINNEKDNFKSLIPKNDIVFEYDIHKKNMMKISEKTISLDKKEKKYKKEINIKKSDENNTDDELSDSSDEDDEKKPGKRNSDKNTEDFSFGNFIKFPGEETVISESKKDKETKVKNIEDEDEDEEPEDEEEGAEPEDEEPDKKDKADNKDKEDQKDKKEKDKEEINKKISSMQFFDNDTTDKQKKSLEPVVHLKGEFTEPSNSETSKHIINMDGGSNQSKKIVLSQKYDFF